MKNLLRKILVMIFAASIASSGITLFKLNVPVSAAGLTIFVDDSNVIGPWDGTELHPYQNIKSGIEHASYGDTVQVSSGTYNENLVVDKSIVLRGDSKPVINAMGGTGMNITVRDDFTYGITVTGFEVTDSSYGIYLTMPNVENLNDTSVTIGDIVLADNTISSSLDAIYVSITNIGYYMYGNSSVTMGDFRVTGNVISSNEKGIMLDKFNYIGDYMYNSSSFSMGNLEITNNTIASRLEGIYLGNIEYFGYYMYGNSRFTMGSILVNNNTIASDDDGIYIYDIYEFGNHMYNMANFTMKNIQFNDNIIYCGSYGIEADYIEYFGNSMEDNSVFAMGNIEFAGNTINCSYLGIYIYELYEFGYDMYGSSQFAMGDLLFNSNIINSSGYGIEVDDFQYFGTYLYGSSSFTMGNVEFCENTLNCTYEGLYLTYAYEFGYEMYGNSKFLMGDFLVNENLINSTDYEGIYAEYLDYWGNDMHDNSKFTMGNIEFSRNTINSKDDGICVYELYEFGYYMYDNASFTMNSILFNDNIIKSESYGISVDNCEYFGGDMHNNSSFSMDNIEFCRNVINSTSDAIGISSFKEFGTYMYGNSSFTMNSVLIKDNVLYSFLWFSTFGTFGSYLYDAALCKMESVEISWNTITSIGKAEDGITFYNLQPFGYDMHNYSLFMMGDFSVSHNSIAGDGDRFGVACTQISEFGTEIYDDASALMGNFEFANNDISHASQGFNLWMVRNAIIRDNIVWNCSYGIIPPESAGNFIYHNRFINNTVQASADLNYANTWDDGYPSGGNYWSEYVDVDEKQGPYQNLTGNDGIWDNPYIINTNNTDRYPFSSLTDNQPPMIGIPSRTPSGDVSPSQEVTVTVSVTDSLNEVKNVTLYFTIDDGAHWDSIEMQRIPLTDLYEGVIPGQEAETTVRFKIEAFDYVDNNATRDGIEPYCIYQVIPEFGSLAIPSLLAIAALVAFALFQKKQPSQRRA